MIRTLILIFTIAGSAFLVPQESAPTGSNAKRLEKIREYLGVAGTLYKEKDYKAAAKKIKAAQALMIRAVGEANEDSRPELEKEHRRLSKAHELLTAQGIEMDPVDPLPDVFGMEDEPSADDESADDAAEMISFTSDVLPVLVKNCGRCHVAADRGEYKMGSFDQLVSGGPQGEAIVAGAPDDSLLFQLIDSGKMPKGKKMVPRETALIKTWIEQGANFDGDDPMAPLPTGSGRGR